MIHLYHDDVLVMKKESQTVALRNNWDLFRQGGLLSHYRPRDIL